MFDDITIFSHITACITDIRLNSKWFPMANMENEISEAATLELEEGVDNDCHRDDCNKAKCPEGVPFAMVCFPLWGTYDCRYVMFCFKFL